MSTIPFTIDGQDIPADAPGAMLTDTEEQLIADAAADYRGLVMHLHATIVGRDVTLTAANCADGLVLFTFGDGAADVEQRVDLGVTPDVTHTYLTDGVFTAQLHHENGDRADLEVPINWPPPPPEGATIP